MKLPEEGMLLRVFIGEADMHDGKPLYEQIVLKARALNLAGATVLRGVMGFGASSRLHTTKILRLSEDLPIVVEIVDVKENLESMLPFLDETVTDGMITMEKARVIKYRHNGKNLAEEDTTNTADKSDYE